MKQVTRFKFFAVSEIINNFKTIKNRQYSWFCRFYFGDLEIYSKQAYIILITQTNKLFETNFQRINLFFHDVPPPLQNLFQAYN